MSTGRRLAKRSIIGTKVCAPGPDGLWYSGVIQDVKTPPNTLGGQLASMDSDTSLTTANTRYQVRFDFKTQTAGGGSGVIMDGRRANANNNSPTQTVRRNAMIKEFRESDLIGPGFRSILGIELLPGQRVFLTYNGRETSGDVVSHDANKDEVVVKITAIGTEEPIELKKRLEEVRLLESRRSARLADQERDTDFARLADMGGDRRRTSHSIEVPLTVTPQTNSRKRPQACGHDCNGSQCNEDEMSDCRAAMILMNLSNSPKLQKNGDKRLGSSPSSSSSSSWSSGSSSPPLSDDGHPALHASPTTLNANDATASARIRTTSVSTSDEGIVVDFAPRKKKAHKTRFLCTWKGCKFSDHRQQKIEGHVRNVHLGSNKKPRHSAELEGTWRESDGEEEFYYTEIEDEDDEGHDTFHEGKQPSPTSPPTLSHRDMARPPHEDPEYQKQIVGKLKQGKVNGITVQNNGKFIHNGSVSVSINSQQQPQHVYQVGNLPTSPLAHHNYTWPKAQSTPTTTIQQQQQPYSASSSHVKHTRSPRPSQSAAPYPSPTYLSQHHNYSSPAMPPHSSTGGANQKVNQNVLHGNTKTNNVLQQLSQQNVTVTAHHCNGSSSTQQQGHRQQQQQQPQLSAVTITPNFHTISSSQSSHHQQQQHQQHHHQIATTINQTQANLPSSQSHQQQQHIHMQHAVAATVRHTPNSPNRRTRGENKKCRKVYGMNRRDEWCIQCKWKKACTRFSD